VLDTSIKFIRSKHEVVKTRSANERHTSAFACDLT